MYIKVNGKEEDALIVGKFSLSGTPEITTYNHPLYILPLVEIPTKFVELYEHGLQEKS